MHVTSNETVNFLIKWISDPLPQGSGLWDSLHSWHLDVLEAVWCLPCSSLKMFNIVQHRWGQQRQRSIRDTFEEAVCNSHNKMVSRSPVVSVRSLQNGQIFGRIPFTFPAIHLSISLPVWLPKSGLNKFVNPVPNPFAGHKNLIVCIPNLPICLWYDHIHEHPEPMVGFPKKIPQWLCRLSLSPKKKMKKKLKLRHPRPRRRGANNVGNI